MKRSTELILVLLAVGGVSWWALAGNEKPETISAIEPAERIGLKDQNANAYHGVAWQIHSSHDVVNKAERIITDIADLGADTILISNAGYQEHAGSATFQLDPKVTPAPEEWLRIFDIAHDNGLRVVLMPIVLLSDPRGTEWRGVIKPPSWDDWFDQYREFLLHFARLARDGDVEVLMVGSELISTERYTDRWRGLIREVRKVFPPEHNIKLSYSGNWDHYKVVRFWDELDLIGMTSYYKLSEEEYPTQEELVEAWKPIQRGLLRWQKKVGKPLLFTEAGWCSQEGAAIEPWNYYYNKKSDERGLEVQLRCYRAFMETWKETNEVGGVIWWEWNDSPGGADDYNYTPKGKPAELALRKWFERMREETRLADKQPS
jgi:hypothetical protein